MSTLLRVCTVTQRPGPCRKSVLPPIMRKDHCHSPASKSKQNICVAAVHKRDRCVARVTLSKDAETVYSGESFYDILGVTPTAPDRDIKLAYYSIMRQYHPDQSGDYEEATEFCSMLNDIYATLSDPDRRTVYDDMFGFSDASINPFLDKAHDRDLIFVDEFACIGCRVCNGVCPKTFTMEEEWGRARAMQQRADSKDRLQEAIDTCPVSCIHWVSAPQLSFLEAAMARMERIAVWSLMSGDGANLHVFTEASIAWEKRFSALREKRYVASCTQHAAGYPDSGTDTNPHAGGLGGMWGRFRNNIVNLEGAAGSRIYGQPKTSSSRYAQGDVSNGSSGPGRASGDTGAGATPGAGGSKEAKSIAFLAARAARASRNWRLYQEVERARKGTRQLAASVSSSQDE